MREEIAYFDDTHLMAGSFLAYCPTLRTFAIVDRMVRLVCLIDRTPHGRVLSKQDPCSSRIYGIPIAGNVGLRPCQLALGLWRSDRAKQCVTWINDDDIDARTGMAECSSR